MSFPHPIRSLAQLPDLASLLDICREFDVEITAFGSLVRRLARSLIATDPRQKALPDLFQLSPFLSDIDLRHSGTTEQTLPIRRAILERVPFSECFRWQVFSEEDLKPFTDDETHRPVIPVNRMSLGTRAGNGIEDPFNASRDLRTEKFRLLRSPFYQRSTLRRTYRDAELLYAIEYMKVLFEESIVDLTEQPGWRIALEIVEDAQTPALIGALEESAYLRAKFWYRSQALRATCPSWDIWSKVIGDEGIGPALEYVTDRVLFDVFDIAQEDDDGGLEDLLVTSCRLVGDRFRLQVPPQNEENYEDAEENWENLRLNRAGFTSLMSNPFPELPTGQRVVADTPEFRFNPGKAPCALGDEHIHIQITLTDECARQCLAYGEEGLAAFLVLTVEELPWDASSETLRSFAFPVPVVCWLKKATDRAAEIQTRLQIRANCGGLLETLPDLLWQVHDTRIVGYRLKLFIVGQS